MNNYNQIDHIKSLSNASYEQVKSVALKRTKNSLGTRPDRNTFKRQQAPLFSILEVLALIVWIAALGISSVHIWKYAGAQANISFAKQAQVLGFSVDGSLYGYIHQFGFFLMAELAMLLFFILFRTKSGFTKWTSLVLTILTAAFVITANLESGLTVFLSLLVPAITIGVGLRADELIVESIRRNKEIDERYHTALTEYELIEKEPEKSSIYRQHLGNEIIQKLASLKVNDGKMNELTPDEKRLLVLRELEREKIFENLDMPVNVNFPTLQIVPSKNGHVTKEY